MTALTRRSVCVPSSIVDEVARTPGRRALWVLNDSGGKDSQAMRVLLSGLVPREDTVVVHAALGEVEWPGALEHARAGAERSGYPFIEARATRTFFDLVDDRFAKRPAVPCWPSKSCRQCTSDLKRGPIEREVRREAKRRGVSVVVNCVGYRWQESTDRAKIPVFRFNARNSKAGRRWYDWSPILAMTVEDVFGVIAGAGEVPHPAYSWGNDRLSCQFCIMGSRNDLRNAAERSPGLYRKYVERERRTGYAMHQSRIPLPQLTGVPVL